MKEVSFEVDCFDVVSSEQVKLIDVATGESFFVPAIKWEWKNEFYAYVTFFFRGQEHTALTEVHPEINY